MKKALGCKYGNAKTELTTRELYSNSKSLHTLNNLWVLGFPLKSILLAIFLVIVIYSYFLLSTGILQDKNDSVPSPVLTTEALW